MSYTIAGKKILNEHMVLGIFGLYGIGGYLATRGGGEKKATASGVNATAGPKTNHPEFNASSSDEESFIKQFLAEAEGDKNPQRQV
ncbi:unnamed protein product [Sympodiomycopsis kandeliae]